MWVCVSMDACVYVGVCVLYISVRVCVCFECMCVTMDVCVKCWCIEIVM